MSFKPGNNANPRGGRLRFQDVRGCVDPRRGAFFDLQGVIWVAERRNPQKAFVSFVFHFTPFSLVFFQFSIFSCVFAPLI